MLFWNGFNRLSNDRQIGMGGSGGIPWTASRRYCDEYGIVGEAREMFFELMEILSGVSLPEVQGEPVVPEIGPLKGGPAPR